MTSRHTSLAALLTVALTSVASAQSAYPPPAQGGVQAYRHASTAAEGYLRGQADLVRGLGEYNYNSASANLINQDAYSRSLDNSYKYAETYFKKRELNAYYRARERGPRASSEALTRFARERAPDRVASHQMDESLGAIYWPALLEDHGFSACREELEALFEQRSPHNSGQGSHNYLAIQHVARDMKCLLSERIDEFQSSDYMQAKKFIETLAYEARFRVEQAPAMGVAAN